MMGTLKHFTFKTALTAESQRTAQARNEHRRFHRSRQPATGAGGRKTKQIYTSAVWGGWMPADYRNLPIKDALLLHQGELAIGTAESQMLEFC
jgi:hypothetical protein